MEVMKKQPRVSSLTVISKPYLETTACIILHNFACIWKSQNRDMEAVPSYAAIYTSIIL